MKPVIIIDNNIPFIKGVFDNIADVRYLDGREINAGNVQDPDALIIRTRTCCNEKLLKNSSVKYIATATIGFDHIDVDYCKKNNISWINAPGSNAGSVLQYIATALFFLQQKELINLSTATIGIVGVGHVGKLVAGFCQTIGMKVLLHDPPRQRSEKENIFVSMSEIVEKSDIITFHTPLNRGGEDNTFQLADDAFFASLQRKPVIINASRGEICDTQALKKAKQDGFISGIVLDCWEKEPDIDRELLEMCDLATPHIAGYSADGKANATTACVQYISKCLDFGCNDWQVKNIPPPHHPVITVHSIAEAILKTYDIQEDSLKLKKNPHDFESFRNHYPIRREFSSYTVSLRENNTAISNILQKIGFKQNS